MNAIAMHCEHGLLEIQIRKDKILVGDENKAEGSSEIGEPEGGQDPWGHDSCILWAVWNLAEALTSGVDESHTAEMLDASWPMAPKGVCREEGVVFFLGWRREFSCIQAVNGKTAHGQ